MVEWEEVGGKKGEVFHHARGDALLICLFPTLIADFLTPSLVICHYRISASPCHRDFPFSLPLAPVCPQKTGRSFSIPLSRTTGSSLVSNTATNLRSYPHGACINATFFPPSIHFYHIRRCITQAEPGVIRNTNTNTYYPPSCPFSKVSRDTKSCVAMSCMSCILHRGQTHHVLWSN